MEDSCGEIVRRKSGVANVGRVGAEIKVSTASYGCITKKWVEHVGKREALTLFFILLSIHDVHHLVNYRLLGDRAEHSDAFIMFDVLLKLDIFLLKFTHLFDVFIHQLKMTAVRTQLHKKVNMDHYPTGLKWGWGGKGDSIRRLSCWMRLAPSLETQIF